MANRYHSPFAPHDVIKVVPKKDGKGWKEPTIIDAQELLLCPLDKRFAICYTY